MDNKIAWGALIVAAIALSVAIGILIYAVLVRLRLDELERKQVDDNLTHHKSGLDLLALYWELIDTTNHLNRDCEKLKKALRQLKQRLRRR